MLRHSGDEFRRQDESFVSQARPLSVERVLTHGYGERRDRGNDPFCISLKLQQSRERGNELEPD